MSRPPRRSSNSAMARVLAVSVPPPPPPVSAARSIASDLEFDFSLPLEPPLEEPTSAASCSQSEAAVDVRCEDLGAPLDFDMGPERPASADDTRTTSAREDAAPGGPMIELELDEVSARWSTPASGVTTPASSVTGTRLALDSQARHAERAERVRALIAEQRFDEALDLIELLRASANAAWVDELEREWALAHNAGADDEAVLAASLGGLGATLSVVASSATIRTLALDHRAGYLLSLIDGVSTIEDILDVAHLPRVDVLRLLIELHERGLIA
jgi:hypothetical protein